MSSDQNESFARQRKSCFFGHICRKEVTGEYCAHHPAYSITSKEQRFRAICREEICPKLHENDEKTGLMFASEVYDAIFEANALKADAVVEAKVCWAYDCSKDGGLDNGGSGKLKKVLRLEIDCGAFPETCKAIAGKCGIE